MNEKPESIVLSDGKRLHVVVEGKPPTCYACTQKGHMSKRCPLTTQQETVMEDGDEGECPTFLPPEIVTESECSEDEARKKEGKLEKDTME